MEQTFPLYIYATDKMYWCTNNKEHIPFMAAIQTALLTKERINALMENTKLIETDYPHILRWLRNRYNKKALHILDYDLPDANWSECSVD